MAFILFPTDRSPSLFFLQIVHSTAEMLNLAFNNESLISKLRDVTEAQQKAEAADAASKRLEEMLSKVNAE